MPSLHFSMKLTEIKRDFVIKLLIDLATIIRFTYINRNNRLPYLFM